MIRRAARCHVTPARSRMRGTTSAEQLRGALGECVVLTLSNLNNLAQPPGAKKSAARRRRRSPHLQWRKEAAVLAECVYTFIIISRAICIIAANKAIYQGAASPKDGNLTRRRRKVTKGGETHSGGRTRMF